MKSLKIFFLAALVALAGAFTACTEDHDWNAGPVEEGAKVYFSNENASSVKVDNTMSSIDLTVMRTETEGILEVSVAPEINPDYASLFTVEPTLIFADGVAEGTVKVSFDYSKLQGGKTYEVAVKIVDETLHSSYAYASQTVSIIVPEPYVLLGKGLYRDDIYASAYKNVTPAEWEVEIYENLNNPGFIYLKDPYLNHPSVEKFKAVYEGVWFAIQYKGTQALIPEQKIGIDVSGDGQMIVGTAKLGTFIDGVITFPVKGLVVAEENYNGGAWFANANANGMFRVVMPGVEVTDYAMEVAYNGMSVAADNKTTEALFKGTYGADVASFKYYFFEDDVTAAAAQIAAAIEAGALEADGEVELETGLDEEDRVFEFSDKGELEAPGKYTVVVVPCNADGEMQLADMAGAAFYYAGVGASEIPAPTVMAKLFPVSVLYGAALAAQYPDHTAIAPLALAENAASARVGLITGLSLSADLEGAEGYECLDYICGEIGATPDQFLEPLDEEDLAALNDPEMGWATIFINLPSNKNVAFFIEVANEAGETAIYVTGGKTAADPAAPTAATVPATGSGVLKHQIQMVEKLTHVMPK